MHLQSFVEAGIQACGSGVAAPYWGLAEASAEVEAARTAVSFIMRFSMAVYVKRCFVDELGCSGSCV